jgi:DNA-binding CsgD family transcriptional regulator
MDLIERDAELASIRYRWHQARTTGGSLILVAGESGIGKTELVRAFTASLDRGTPVAWGACDPLHTPRPLGALHDGAPELGDRVGALLATGAAPYELCAAVLEALTTRSRVLVVDDVHWADDGTLDVLRFLLRRLTGTRSLVLATYRDDEVTASHPLRGLLGDVARSPDAISLALRPLSREAVASAVADRPIDPARLHAITGGNPFFVAEVLAHDADELPGTVRDAVLARTIGLDGDARDLLDLLACAPEAVPDDALRALGVRLETLRALDATGLIEHGRRGLGFRHELCRMTIADALPPGGATALHARVLAALEPLGSADPAILTHHAVGAGDAARVVHHAQRAGANASGAGAHSLAADFYGVALDAGSATAPRERAAILELLAAELYLTDRLPDAIAACERAMALRESAGDASGVSAVHEALSVYNWYAANRDVAERHASAAVEAAGERLRLGHAYATEAYLAMQKSDLPRARSFHERARGIAAEVGDRQLAARVEITDSVMAIMGGDLAGRERILSLIERDAEYFDDLYSAGYSNLANMDVEQRRLREAGDVLAISLPLTVTRDIPICHHWQLGVRARMLLLCGDWDAAAADADEVLRGRGAPLARTWPHLVRGLVALRRGDERFGDDLDDAFALAGRFGEPLRLLPAYAALAERAWLQDATDPRLDAAAAQFGAFTGADGLEWSIGDLAVWLRRLGYGIDVEGARLAEPHRLALAGRPLDAAAAWEELDAPYDRALALIDAGDDRSALAALEVLDALGADAVAARLRRQLRARGVAGVPGRRRAATRANSAGLTARQLEVLPLLAEGLTNQQLADRLFISPKTADHHVSAILAKLCVSSRREAADAARRLGVPI